MLCLHACSKVSNHSEEYTPRPFYISCSRCMQTDVAAAKHNFSQDSGAFSPHSVRIPPSSSSNALQPGSPDTLLLL